MKCYRSTSLSRITEMGDPAWRPPHFPPPCEDCGGFGWRRSGELEQLGKCRTCRGSGNAVPLAEWIARHHA